MKIVFMGTPDFAVPSLKILVDNGYEISAVVTVADKPAGRGQQLSESPVKKYAVANGIKVLQPVKLKDPGFLSDLLVLNADLFVVVAFRMLPQEVWSMPAKGTFNLHGSLLPQYRGAAPINRAIMNGEKETGVTTFFLKHEIDTGSIIFRERIPIGENETAGELHDRMMIIGSHLVLNTVRAIESGDYPKIEQDTLVNGELKHAPKIFREDCKINWNETTLRVHNHIRGLSPYPGAWTNITGSTDTFKIFRTQIKRSEKPLEAGKILSGKDFFAVACNDGWLDVLEVQAAGKRRMTIQEFLAGNKIDPYFSFS